MIPDSLTPAQWASHAVRYQARAILAELCAPGLDPECSLAMLRDTVLTPLRLARFEAEQAQHHAENRTPAAPDDQAADRYCGWCGATNPAGGLADDALPLSADGGPLDPAQLWQGNPDAAWFCADLTGCLARRRERYPDRQTPELTAARERFSAARQAAEPARVALSAFVAACAQYQAHGRALALSAPECATRPRQAVLTGEDYRAARVAHTMRNPRHRAWTEGARRGR
jgi:hypothetical protein